MVPASTPPPPARVHGIDGCRGGWLRATARPEARDRCALIECAVHATPEQCLAETIGEPVAIDMPIGLLERARAGGRECDIAARRLLGWPRRTSVFSPPARPALTAGSYREAIASNGAGMTREAYNLLAKIRALDQALASARPGHVVEAHPELAFMRLAREAIAASKRTPAGLARRRELLESALGHDLDVEGERERLGRNAVAPDDLVDAVVLTLTAHRLARGDARRLGSADRDARGLEMAIYY